MLSFMPPLQTDVDYPPDFGPVRPRKRDEHDVVRANFDAHRRFAYDFPQDADPFWNWQCEEPLRANEKADMMAQFFIRHNAILPFLPISLVHH